MDKPGGISVEDVSNVTEPMIKKFKVNITTIGTDSCLLVNYVESTTIEMTLPTPGPDDEPDIIAYGSERSCSEIFPGINYRMMDRELSNTIELEHVYQMPGNYVVSFKVRSPN